MHPNLRTLLKTIEEILIKDPNVSWKEPFDVSPEYKVVHRISTMVPDKVIYKGTRITIEFHYLEPDR